MGIENEAEDLYGYYRDLGYHEVGGQNTSDSAKYVSPSNLSVCYVIEESEEVNRLDLLGDVSYGSEYGCIASSPSANSEEDSIHQDLCTTSKISH